MAKTFNERETQNYDLRNGVCHTDVARGPNKLEDSFTNNQGGWVLNDHNEPVWSHTIMYQTSITLAYAEPTPEPTYVYTLLHTHGRLGAID